MTGDPRPITAALLPHADGRLSALVEGLDPEHAAELARMAHVRHCDAGEVLLSEGADPTEIGYIIHGALGMTKTLPDARQHIIGLLVEGDMFGRLFDGPLSYRIEALTPARILTFERAGFESLLRRAPEIERQFLVSLLDELDAAREWLMLLGGTRLLERVAGFLLILVRRRLAALGQPGREALTIEVPIRRADLASYLGARPESLSRTLHRLERDGILAIESVNRFRITDLARLVDVSGQDLVLRGEHSHDGEG